MIDTIHDISAWVIRLMLLLLVAREQRPNTAVAWLAAIFFLPQIGLVLYLLFGAYRLRRGVEGHQRVREELELILYSSDVATILCTMQQRYLERSRCLERCSWQARPISQQLLEHTAKRLSLLL